MVKVDFASHSPQMNRCSPNCCWRWKKCGLSSHPCRFTLPCWTLLPTGRSSMRSTGRAISGSRYCFQDRCNSFWKMAITFLEISAHPLSAEFSKAFISRARNAGICLHSAEGRQPTAMLRSLGLLYSSGYAINWNRIYPERGEFVRLPAYPSQRQRCWLEPGADRDQPIHTATSNSLLGRHFKSAESSGADYWEIRLDKESLPFLDDHRIEDRGVARINLCRVGISRRAGGARVAIGHDS